MKKKLFGMLLAGALVASQCVTAFAAGSQEAAVGNVSGLSTVSGGYTVDADVSASISELPAERQERVQTEISNANAGDLNAIADTLANEEHRDLLRSVNVLTPVFELKGEAGEVTFTVANLPAKTQAVYALHLKTDGTWEVLPASFDLATGKVTVSFSSLSPVMIVAKTAPEGGSRRSHSRSSSDDASGVAAAAEMTADGLYLSPKTGITSDWMLWMGMAVVLFGVFNVAFRRTKA